MDFNYFVEVPLLKVVFYFFIAGVLLRIFFFIFSMLKGGREKDSGPVRLLIKIPLAFFPLHKVFLKRPLYVSLRYLFHALMIIIPIWFSGHIALWEESSFEWYWTSIPDNWADGMTLLLLIIAAYFVIRRLAMPGIRAVSAIKDYVIILMAALPFLTGYFLTHGTLETVPFFENNLLTIHILSAEAFMAAAVFLFLRTRLNTEKCTTCGACDMSCPTGTLEARDEGAMRIFNYAHYQCVCCGACMNTCTENAAELRHELSFVRFFQIASKQEIRSARLMACEGCGKLFVPEPQLNKISHAYPFEYTHFCPLCRKVNLGEVLLHVSQRRGQKKIKHSAAAAL